MVLATGSPFLKGLFLIEHIQTFAPAKAHTDKDFVQLNYLAPRKEKGCTALM